MMRLTAAAVVALLLAGCASFSSDGGFDKVSELTKDRTGQAATWRRTPSDGESAQNRANEILAEPLTADRAVELALLNNPGLQASHADLGIAEADLVRAGRLANPTFGFGRLSGGAITEIDRSIMFSVLGLLTIPMATQVEQRRFEQAQYQAASTTVGLAADTRKAFFIAVASQDLVKYYQRVKEAADASNERNSPAGWSRQATSTSSRRCASKPSMPTRLHSSRGLSTKQQLSASGSFDC